METYEERDRKIKRSGEELQDLSKEVKASDRIEYCWKYLEEVKKLQELEIQIEQVKKKLKLKEQRFPDLKNLRGNVDHISCDRFWEVEDDFKKRVVPGKTLADATEKYKKKLAQDAKNAQAQKEKNKNQ